MANMNIEGTLGSMFKGMDGFISSKSVVGEPVYVGDTIIIPLVDVNFGMAAGAFNKQDGNKAAGGIGAKMSPSAVLVVSGGNTRTCKSQEPGCRNKDHRHGPRGRR